jgi:hypothetical protein
MSRNALSLSVVLWLAHVAAGQDGGDHPFRGRIVDASGQPAAGATVRLLSLRTIGTGQDYEVDESTKADADGRFKLVVPYRWLRLPGNFRQELGIVAVHDGRMTGILISRRSLPPKGGLELALPAATQTKMTVRSPQGTPVAGATVRIHALLVEQITPDLTDEEVRAYAAQVKKSRNGYIVSRDVLTVPSAMRSIAGKTDAEGQVTLAGLAPSQIGGVEVECAEFGTQIVFPDVHGGQRKFVDWPGKIVLQPVGRIRGQLVGAKAGREITIVANSGTPERMYGGLATAHTDADGKFEVPKIAIGTVRVRVAFDEKTPDRIMATTKPPPLKPGATLEWKAGLKPAVRLSGMVLNAETRKPVATVHVLAGTEQEAFSAITDAAGKFTLWVAAGKVTVLPQVPEGFLETLSPDDWDSPEKRIAAVPKDIDVAGEHVELPPLLLHPEATLRGLVVDERGGPVAGATVSAISRVIDNRKGSAFNREVSVTADERGEFAVAGIDPRVAIRLRVQAKDATRIVTIAKPGKDPVRIAMASQEAFRLQGRVVDATGHPVADAALELWHRDWRPPPAEGEPKKLTLKETIRTDSTGTFSTPALLPDGQYRFVIRAAGVKTCESPWLDATLPETAKPQTLAVTRLGGQSGVVRDAQGKPVGDAQITLFSGELRVATASNAQGEFKLETPGGKPFCVVVRHPDFRVHGNYYEKDPANFDQTLTRLSEPAAARMPRTILAKEERQRLLQTLLEPYKQRLQKGVGADEKMRAAQVLGTVDPEFLLEYLTKNPLKPAMMQDSALQWIVKAWAPRRSDDAAELIERMQTPYIKAVALCEIAGAMPDKAKSKKLEILAEALVAARAEKAPQLRVIVLGFVGRRLIDLGEKERATAVLREAEKTAGGLTASNFNGYARGSFATDLAMIDLPAALALIKDLKDHHELQRHHGNVAHRIAATQPAEAIKVLDLIPGPKANEFNQRDHYAIRACYRMAAVDLKRALALADTIEDVLSRAQAIGAVAQAVGPKDMRTATDLLRRAFTLLEDDAVRPDPAQLTTPLTPASVAAVLVFNAEAIDRSLVQECLWRAVALQRTPTDDPEKVWRYQTANNALTMTIARYDPKLAALLLPAPSKVMQSREAQLAHFLVHPERTVQAATKAQSPDTARVLTQLIGYIGTEEDQLPRLIHHTLGIWRIDGEDLDI